MQRCLRLAALATVFLGVFLAVGTAQFDIPTLPGGAASGDSIDFGGVPVGQTRSSQYTFRVLESSQTAARVTIYDPCPPFGLSGLAARSMTLQPGQSVTFNVTFTPKEARSYSCSFKIRAEGGRPVQVKETVVHLSGRGVSEGAASPGASESPLAAFPFGLIATQPPVTEGGEVFEGATNSQGRFQISVPPTTTVAGTVAECGGGPIASEMVELRLVSDGYGISVRGYQEAVAKVVSKIAFFGTESIDLGEICLQPIPATEAQAPEHIETEESDRCPCCAIIVEARMCCDPREQYAETDEVYEPQLVRIRVSYCEPVDAFIDATPAPSLAGPEGILWDPQLPTSQPVIPDTSRIGVTAITLDGRALFEGAGEIEKTVSAGALSAGKHTVQATIGRYDGSVCRCEKTFEVLPCPEVSATLRRTLDPDTACSPVAVTYELDWPGGLDDICRILFWDESVLDPHTIRGFPLTRTYKSLDQCRPRRLAPGADFYTNNCCRYEVLTEPFDVLPVLRMSNDCVCLQVIGAEGGHATVRLVFRNKVQRGDDPGCYFCATPGLFSLRIRWGDGTESDQNDVVRSDDAAGDWYVEHRYDIGQSQEGPPVNIHVEYDGPCGEPVVVDLTGKCELPEVGGLQETLARFDQRATEIAALSDIVALVRGLDGLFNLVGQSARPSGDSEPTTICSVLLAVRLKGIDLGSYRSLNEVIDALGSGGVVARTLALPGATLSVKDKTEESTRFLDSGSPADPLYNAAKVVYVPGERPYFELVISSGSCSQCPVAPTYVLRSVLENRLAQRHIEEARASLGRSGEPSTAATYGQTVDITLQIGLCCPPRMCDE